MDRTDVTQKPVTRLGERATDSAQSLADRATDTARTLAERAQAQVERMTGRPLAAWTNDANRAVRDYPVRALLGAVALGYVIGKLGRSR